MIALSSSLGRRLSLVATLLLASCDLGTPMPALAQLVSGPATAGSSSSSNPASVCQPWQSLNYSSGWACTQQSGLIFLAGKSSAANLNAAAPYDVSIALSGPSTGIWLPVRAVFSNCSTVSTSFAGTFYTSSGGGGSIFMGAANMGLGSAGVGATAGTFSRIIAPPTSFGSTNWNYAFNATASGTVYFRVTTAAGSAQTCDISIYAEVL